MAAKINVIKTPKMVYATYHETICFKASITDENVIIAKASAFSYGQYYGSCLLQIVEVEEDWNDNDVFNFLEKINK